MKHILYIVLFLSFSFSFAQVNEQQKEEQRVQKIKNELTALSATNSGLTENLKTEIDVVNITLPNFLKAAYIQQMPFDAAMENLAFANNLYVEKSKEGFYIFENGNTTVANSNNTTGNQSGQRPVRRRKSNFFFKVKNPETKLLEVDFANTPIADIINDIGNELKIDVFTATPLDNAGTATFKAKSITFDALLDKVFESQNSTAIQSNNGVTQQNTNQNPRPQQGQTSSSKEIFTYKKEGDVYFFGTEKQLSVRKVEIVQLKYRSVELLSDPSGGNSRNRNFNNSSFNSSTYNNQFDNRNFNQNNTGNINNGNRQSGSRFNDNFSSNSGSKEDLLSIVPDENRRKPCRN